MRAWLGLLALWLLAGCGADRGVTIGVLMWGPTGPDVTRVVEAWLAEQGPGLPPVRFVVDSAPPQDGRTVHASVRWLEAAEAMVRQRDLVAVVGHIGSRESLVTAPIYARARVPLIVPTGTSRLLGMAGPWVLPLAPGETEEGRYLVRQATDRFGARTITLFQFNDEYGVGLGDAVVAEAASAGLTVLDRALVPFGARADYDAAVGASLLRGTPDLVIVAARPAALAGITRALRSRGLAIPVIAGDGADAPPTLAALGADRGRTRVPSRGSPAR